MSSPEPQLLYPGVINWRRHARNGKRPSAQFKRSVANTLVHVAAYRRKLVFSKSRSVQSRLTGAAGTTAMWYSRFVTGDAADRIVVAMLFLKADNAAATDPRILWRDESGSKDIGVIQTPGTDPATGGAPDDFPNDFGFGWLEYQVSADTAYELRMDAIDYARPLSACIYDVSDSLDDSLPGVVSPAYGVQQPILESQHDDLVIHGMNLWQHNAPVLGLWNREGDSTTAPTHTGSTWTNIHDGSTSVDADASAGVRVQNRYHNSYGESGVPVVLAVRAERTAGTGTARFRLTDGTQTLTVTGITSAGWYTVSGTLTAQDLTKLDPQAWTGDGSTTLRIDAWTLYEYES